MPRVRYSDNDIYHGISRVRGESFVVESQLASHTGPRPGRIAMNPAASGGASPPATRSTASGAGLDTHPTLELLQQLLL